MEQTQPGARGRSRQGGRAVYRQGAGEWEVQRAMGGHSSSAEHWQPQATIWNGYLARVLPVACGKANQDGEVGDRLGYVKESRCLGGEEARWPVLA